MFFKAIHDKNRQMILDVIKSQKNINANGIVEKINLSQPTISHHLKILEKAAVIKTQKVGKEIKYSINNDAIAECCVGFMNKFYTKTA